MTILVGKYAMVPARIAGDRKFFELRVDLYETGGMFLEIDDLRFAVSRDALQSLIDAYDEAQVRVHEAG
jgi:hypothetical protein